MAIPPRPVFGPVAGNVPDFGAPGAPGFARQNLAGFLTGLNRENAGQRAQEMGFNNNVGGLLDWFRSLRQRTPFAGAEGLIHSRAPAGMPSGRGLPGGTPPAYSVPEGWQHPMQWDYQGGANLPGPRGPTPLPDQAARAADYLRLLLGNRAGPPVSPSDPIMPILGGPR